MLFRSGEVALFMVDSAFLQLKRFPLVNLTNAMALDSLQRELLRCESRLLDEFTLHAWSLSLML